MPTVKINFIPCTEGIELCPACAQIRPANVMYCPNCGFCVIFTADDEPVEIDDNGDVPLPEVISQQYQKEPILADMATLAEIQAWLYKLYALYLRNDDMGNFDGEEKLISTYFGEKIATINDLMNFHEHGTYSVSYC